MSELYQDPKFGLWWANEEAYKEQLKTFKEYENSDYHKELERKIWYSEETEEERMERYMKRIESVGIPDWIKVPEPSQVLKSLDKKYKYPFK